MRMSLIEGKCSLGVCDEGELLSAEDVRTMVRHSPCEHLIHRGVFDDISVVVIPQCCDLGVVGLLDSIDIIWVGCRRRVREYVQVLIQAQNRAWCDVHWSGVTSLELCELRGIDG